LRVQLHAAYASFGGAAWLEGLARLFGGAPVAAKVAAIGVGAATVTGSAVVVPQVLEQSRRAVSPAHVHAPVPRAPKPRAEAPPPPLVALAAQQTNAPRRATALSASSDEQHVTHDTAEVQRHDGGDAAEQATRTRTAGPDDRVSVPLKEPVQQETNDSRDEAGVTVQAELEPPPTRTTEGHDGGDGIDGSGGGD
jgi:hypothetical protein